MDPWIVQPAERARHLEQFKSLNPIGGFVTGDQAKGFLLQSQLPPATLGQIWSLADVNCDGKMDINEFSVACKLITNKLKGFEVPPALPQSLKNVLAGTGTSTPILSPSGSSLMSPSGSMGMGMGIGIGMPHLAAGGIRPPPSIVPLVPQSQPQPVMLPGAYAFPQTVAAAPAPVMVPLVQPGVMMPMPPASLPIGSQGLSQIPGAAPVAQMVMPMTMPAQDLMNQQRSMSITSQDSVTSPTLQEWAVPTGSRLKYTQIFNQNDRSKSGYLSGVQARNLLMNTGHSQQVLASIWALSDLDSDGRLSCEEFILAMHLCDVARQTGRLPPKLPAELIPPSFRTGSRKQSIKSIPPGSISITGSGHNTPNSESGGSEQVLSPGGTTFEDKRKMNYDKGQAELDRRRRVLEEQAHREREERERKEREEYDKREKQRLEAERKKQEEMERQLSIQREMEERRLEEFRKAEEQKEAARKEMERQRQLEMEENKRLELQARRQKEQDEVLRLKGVNHGLGLELSQLAERVKELSSKITETRIGVSTVKNDIDGMRAKRDGFMQENASLKAQLKEQNNRMLHVAQEKIRLEKSAAESDVKHINLKQLREKLLNMKEELAKKQSDSDTAVSELDELKSTLSTLIESCKTIYEEYQDKREKVMTMRKKHHAEFDYNAAWGAPVKRMGSIHEPEPETEEVQDFGVSDGTGAGPVYYRALFDFDARNADELGFTVGAIIQRDDSVVPDPGWLSGILNGQYGIFPESFVEVMPGGFDEAPPPASRFSQQASVESQIYNANALVAPEAGEYYVALYPYESAEPGDLPFDAGETILVTHAEGEWWTGSIGPDRVGLFPANYVAKSEPGGDAGFGADSYTAAPPTINDNYTSHTLTAYEQSLQEENKRELEPYEEAEIKREISEIASGKNQGPPKSPKSTTKSKKYEIATVLASYQANSEGQLSLTRGQLITVRKKSASGWWEGELQAKGKKREIGWFPGSYVKILGPSGGSRTSSSRTTPIPFDEIVMPTTVAPIYTDTKEQMIALFPYTAQNSDELTFIKDDVISVISKDEPDWWRGQLGSAVGLFPVNYVQPLASQGDGESQSSGNQSPPDEPDTFAHYGWTPTIGNGTLNLSHSNSNGNGFSTTTSASASTVQEIPVQNVELEEFQEHAEDDDEWDEEEEEDENDDFDQGNNSKCPRKDNNIDTTTYGFTIAHSTTPTPNNHSSAVGSIALPVINMSFGSEECKRQEAIKELIQTEEKFMEDLDLMQSCFMWPIHRSGLLTPSEFRTLFVNIEDIVDCSYKLLKSFTIRSKTNSENNQVILMIGDILCQHLPAMNAYIRFCSAQLRAAAFIQHKSETKPAFLELTKKCQSSPEAQYLPLSSFLLKPMQRITRYPLLIKKILSHTPESHPDRQNLEEALSKAEELCSQVNEGVREKENSDRLEWMQNHINCAGFEERLIFNSLTNSLGPRKFLHHGILKKTKSGKELLGLLFNDFLLLAQPSKPFGQSTFSFDRNKHSKFKIYRKPLFLNDIIVEEDTTLNESEFIISTEKKTYRMVLAAPGISEKRLWIRRITEAQKRYHQVQQQYMQRQKSKKTKAVGRLLVTVMEANHLFDKKKCVRKRGPKGKLEVVVVEGISLANRDQLKGKSDPYCEVSLGSEIRRTTVINGTLNPKWFDSMQFSVKDLQEDILCLTVYDKDYFSPDQFLGRTEIALSKIYEETKYRKTPWTKTFPLLEIESGEITIKLHLQIFDSN